MKLSIKEAETFAQQDGKLPEGAEVIDDAGNVVDFKITVKAAKEHTVEVVREHESPPVLPHTSFHLFVKKLQAFRATGREIKVHCIKRSDAERKLTVKVALSDPYSHDDAASFADGSAFVTDDILPALVPEFDDTLINNLAHVPLSQNSMRLISFDAGDNYQYVQARTGQGYQNAVNKATVENSGLTTSGVGYGQSISLVSYAGELIMSDELMEDVPSFQAQASEVLSNELTAQLQKGATTAIYGSNSYYACPRITADKIAAGDLWNLYSHAIKKGPKSRYAWLVSPSAAAVIQSFRDSGGTGMGVYFVSDPNNLGTPAVRFLGLPLIECWYAQRWAAPMTSAWWTCTPSPWA